MPSADLTRGGYQANRPKYDDAWSLPGTTEARRRDGRLIRRTQCSNAYHPAENLDPGRQELAKDHQSHGWSFAPALAALLGAQSKRKSSLWRNPRHRSPDRHSRLSHSIRNSWLNCNMLARPLGRYRACVPLSFRLYVARLYWQANAITFKSLPFLPGMYAVSGLPRSREGL